MNLNYEIDLIWQDFKLALEREKEEARIMYGKLIRITKDTKERKKLLFALVKSYSLEENRFSIPKFRKLLKKCKIEHLESEVIFSGNVG